MNVLIVDDEQLARQRLKKMLAASSTPCIIAEAENGEEALRKSQHAQPDIVLMDIRMPGMDGIEAASYMNKMEHPPAIIFTTAYNDHALEAFTTHAIDYLVKPIKQQRLEKALQAARRINKAQISLLKATSNTARSTICIKQGNALELIPVDEILYFKAEQKYVTVRTDEREYLIEEPLKRLEEEFNHRFIRVHRNALVAQNAIHGLIKTRQGHHCVGFREIDYQLEISRRHLPAIRKNFKKKG